jgi:hypothetical protein
LSRLEQLDAIGVDDDVEGGARYAEGDSRDRDQSERVLGIRHAQERDREDHQHADQPQPAATLAEAADQRQPDVVDDRRPQELEVVGKKGEREGRDRAFGDAVLREARSQRRADHREGEARRHAEEQSCEGRALDVGAHALRQPKAHGRSR